MRLFTLSLLGILSLQVAPAVALNLGDTIPKKVLKTELLNVDGQKLNLKTLQGTKGTLVIFSCNHCPFVKAWNKRMIDIGNEYSAQGLGVVAINSNDPTTTPEDGFDTMKERAKTLGMKYPFVVDSTSAVAKAFGATKTPEAYLFDSKGKLVYQGAVDSDFQNETKATPWLRNAITEMLAGKPVTLKTGKAVGCGIKFRG